jgi:hypothetical protein
MKKSNNTSKIVRISLYKSYPTYEKFKKSLNYWLSTVNIKTVPRNKSLFKVTIKLIPSAHINVNLSNWATLTKKTTHVDVIRSPHIDKKSREQFNKIIRKFVHITNISYPYIWLGQCIHMQTQAMYLEILEKKRVIFYSKF